ncbi:MAG: transposase [Candidatus Poribacteria bacterium]|nr:transposase [Candidatus Poribacteria bacterium]
MKQAFKYRVYPTQTEEQWLFSELRHQKQLQNYMLQMRSQMWAYGSVSVSMYDQINHLKKLRESNTHYSKHPQDMQVSTIKRVNAAHEHFQRRCKEGAEKKGYPRYKSSVRSLTWELRKYKVKNERVRQNPIRETGKRHNMLKVPKLGEVKIRQHRPLIGDPKEVTLKKTVRGWYCFIVCEVPDTMPCIPKSACGVDVGTHDFLTTSTGEKVPNPRFYRQTEHKFVKLQRDLSRKQYRSKRWYKAKDALAKQADIVACQRLDFIAKTAYKLFHHNGFDVVVSEKLKPSNMVKNRYLAKSISDASWGMFFDWCDWVAKRDGKHFHQVPPHHTSQTCSECCQKSKTKLKLSERVFHCKSCGLKLDRDHNAAINILNRAACALRGEVWDTILYETRNQLLQLACWG